MRICFVLSHPSSYLYGEVREAMVAADLARLGHEVRIFRAHHPQVTQDELFQGTVPVTFFPTDDPGAAPHAAVSDALLAALRVQPPDLVLLKGLGYDLVSRVLQQVPSGAARIGIILGGLAVDPALARADFVLTESDGQAAEIQQFLGRSLPCRRLPKYLDWATADRLHAARLDASAEYDIVNVGGFEPRKNQIALRAFFGRHRVALVGAGETQAEVAAAAAGQPGVHLLGPLPNAEALGVMARARLMVHPSLWEGVPRVILESLACGTPVLAHSFAIQERFEGTQAVRLVTAEELVPAAEALLADPPLLQTLGEEGRAYARDRHGAERLAKAAGQILALAGAAG